MQTTAERPRLYRWSRLDYERLVEIGLLEGRHVELIGGEIVQMSPKGPRHATTTVLLVPALEGAFAGIDCHVRPDLPLALGDWDEPEPDVAVVVGGRRDYAEAHPTAARTLLVVEVADTTAAYDLGAKADRYAAAGLEDYWLVLPAARAVAVLRRPAPDPADPARRRYAERRDYRADEAIAPLAAPGRAVRVADLLV
jgi:Uma2 family endonuclease